MHKFVTTLVLLTCLTISASAQTSVPDYTLGSWAGYMKQEGKLEPFWVAVSITNGTIGDVVGTVSYGEDMCGGELVYEGLNEEGLPVFREQITRKPYRCFNNGRITFLFDEEAGKYAIDWKHPNNYLFSACYATLDKVGQ